MKGTLSAVRSWIIPACLLFRVQLHLTLWSSPRSLLILPLGECLKRRSRGSSNVGELRDILWSQLSFDCSDVVFTDFGQIPNAEGLASSVVLVVLLRWWTHQPQQSETCTECDRAPPSVNRERQFRNVVIRPFYSVAR